MIDIAKTSAVVLAWPDNRVSPGLLWWLAEIGIPPARIHPHKSGGNNQCAGWNWSIKTGLDTGSEFLIFAENDISPSPEPMVDFLASEADVTGVVYDNGNPNSFKRVDEIHLALWWTRREVLESLTPPWFTWPTNDDGTESGCLCQPFNRRLIAAGYSVANAGQAAHTPKTRRHL